MINYEKDGFSIEQKFTSKNYKSYIYYDNVTSKKGYCNTKDTVSIIAAACFCFLIIFDFYSKKGHTITYMIYASVILFFVYSAITSTKKYTTLILKNGGPIYFTKKDEIQIDEIIKNRNKYFYETYFNNISSYDEQVKSETLKWLFDEKVITESEYYKVLNN
jgi:hypothetical protein